MSEHMKQRMQEKLDGILSDEMTEELFAFLDSDSDAAREYALLEHVDHLLSAAPHARAPQRLAITILARLAETVQAEADRQQMPEEMRQALMLSVSLVVLAMLPLMLAASYLVMNGLREPELLNQVFQQVVALLLMMVDALVLVLKEMERTVRERPDLALLALSLLPIVLLGMLDYIEKRDPPGDDGA